MLDCSIEPLVLHEGGLQLEVYIAQDGKKLGPYSKSQLLNRLDAGLFEPDDLAWKEGLAQWVPLTDILPEAANFQRSTRTIATQRPVSTTTKFMGFSDRELVSIGDNQRAVIWLILALFITGLFAGVGGMPIYAFVAILSIIFTYRFAKSLREVFPEFYAFLVCIPLFGVLALLVLNTKAIRALRNRGVRIHFLGANKADLDQLRYRVFQ